MKQSTALLIGFAFGLVAGYLFKERVGSIKNIGNIIK